MRQMRADATLELQQEQRADLGNVAHSRCTPRAVARRARIVLLTAEDISPGAIDAHFGVSPPTCARGVAAALGRSDGVAQQASAGTLANTGRSARGRTDKQDPSDAPSHANPLERAPLCG